MNNKITNHKSQLKILVAAIGLSLGLQAGNALAVQAGDGSANHANTNGLILEFSSAGVLGNPDQGNVTITPAVIGGASATLAATNVTFDGGSGTFAAAVHPNTSAVYTLKDSNDYCWDITYTASVESGGSITTAAFYPNIANGTVKTGAAYETACANVTASVAAPFASYLGLPMLFAAFASMGFVANKRKKS